MNELNNTGQCSSPHIPYSTLFHEPFLLLTDFMGRTIRVNEASPPGDRPEGEQIDRCKVPILAKILDNLDVAI